MEDLAIQLYIEDKKPISEVLSIMRSKGHKIGPKKLRKIIIERGFEIRSKNASRERNVDRDTLYDLYINQNKSYEDIAKILGIGRGTVGNYLAKYNITKRTPVEGKAAKSDNYTLWNKERMELCRVLLERYQNYKQVAEMLECSIGSVSNVNLNYLHVPMTIWQAVDEEEARKYLDETRDYIKTGEKFGIDPQNVQYKNNREWHVDLSANMTMFGQPTRYNGTLYRSKHEALIAEILTDHNIRFEYERRIGDGTKTCDFYLEDHGIWMEYDGLAEFRYKVQGSNYDDSHPKIKFYKENNFNYMILRKKTWRKQLMAFLNRR